ncbi:MAG: hypothetical protein RIQ60_241 [Pseudomonadota bacterium]|jgi:putative peptide zinc metalloprotease protein
MTRLTRPADLHDPRHDTLHDALHDHLSAAVPLGPAGHAAPPPRHARLTLPAQLDAQPLPAHDGDRRRKATRSAPSRHARLDELGAPGATGSAGAPATRHGERDGGMDRPSVYLSLFDTQVDTAPQDTHHEPAQLPAPASPPSSIPSRARVPGFPPTHHGRDSAHSPLSSTGFGPTDADAQRETQAYTRQLIEELRSGQPPGRNDPPLHEVARQLSERRRIAGRVAAPDVDLLLPMGDDSVDLNLPDATEPDIDLSLLSAPESPAAPNAEPPAEAPAPAPAVTAAPALSPSPAPTPAPALAQAPAVATSVAPSANTAPAPVRIVVESQVAPAAADTKVNEAPVDAASPRPARPRWPTLRDDLQLHHGPALHDGEPSWTLQDPVRHRFLRIDWLSYEVLRRWWLADPELIADQINHQTTLAVDSDHVLQVLTWAVREQLVHPLTPPPAAMAHDKGEDASQLGALARWLLHHYLFFRVPLFNPDRLLARLLPWLSPLGSRAFSRLTLLAGLLGGLGVLREVGLGAKALQAQWLDLLSWQGAALYGLTLALVKVAHEFGHALVAKHHGLRVPTMGAAFMVMWPVAYTDTSEAWRLSDAKARLKIAAAGVRTELTLAAWATLAWVLLPDGPARTAAFIVATMTWVSSIAINASPFMRFDGYYLLCDWLDLPNLHERSFALARWQMRRGLLGWQAEEPEQLGAKLKRWLVAFAVATWVYRLVLYLGIAWMVYHFGFPALGLLLFAVELGWFIAAPVQRELALWFKGWSRWRAAWRWRWSALALAGAAGLAAWPWPVRESAGALLEPTRELALRVPASVTLRQLKVQLGQRVAAGTPLLQAELPGLAHKSDAAQLRIRQLEQQVAIASLNGEQKAEWRSLQASLATARQEAGALRLELARFQPAAPFDAVVVELDTSLVPGSVLSPQQTVLRLASPGSGHVLAWVSEYAAAHIRPGDNARFSADALPLQRFGAHVVSVAPHASTVLDEPMLARQHGGPVEAHEAGNRWLPATPRYKVELALDDEPGLAPRHWRGHVVFELPGRSGWQRAWSAAAEVMAREVGF